MIEIKHLTKKFGAFTAVDDLSFNVKKGEVLGFLGPNGAGKSTSMKMIAGALTPTFGNIHICGIDITKNPIAVKKKIGYLPEGAPAWGDMSVVEFLKFIANIHGLFGKLQTIAIDKTIELTQLSQVLQQPIDILSKGFKRRVGLAQTLLHDPEILIMDEPTDGLDPNQKHDIRQLITNMASEKSIIISTHILEEVEAICSRAIIIANGKILADGTPDQLQRMAADHNGLHIHLTNNNSDSDINNITKSLLTLKYVDDVIKMSENHIMIRPENRQNISTIISKHMSDNSFNFDQIYLEKGRLDSVFRDITTINTSDDKGLIK